IRSAAGIDANPRLAGQLLEGRFEHLLDGAKAWLRLPTAEVGAVVAQDEFEVPHVFSPLSQKEREETLPSSPQAAQIRIAVGIFPGFRDPTWAAGDGFAALAADR